MNIGERIKQRRKEIGLSAEQVAEKLGVAPATVYRYESNDIANMRIDKLEPIAKALNTTPAYLMGWEESENKKKTIEALLDQKPRQAVIMYKDGSGKQETKELSEEQYKKVLKFLDMLDN